MFEQIHWCIRIIELMLEQNHWCIRISELMLDQTIGVYISELLLGVYVYA